MSAALVQYVGRKGIYFERGYVLEVEIVNVSPMENNQEGAAFNMAIKRTILQQGPFLMQEEDGFLNVGSIHIDVDNEVIRASGYAVWTIVLNEADLGELRQAFEKEPATDAYSICRRIMRRAPATL